MEKTINSADKKYASIGDVIRSFKKYRFLIRQLIIRDFKLKYKKSLLGVLWSFLNPLFYMAVLYVIFPSCSGLTWKTILSISCRG